MVRWIFSLKAGKGEDEGGFALADAMCRTPDRQLRLYRPRLEDDRIFF